MAQRPIIAALCLLAAAFSAAGQEAGSVRDFSFTVELNPALSLSNPAMLDQFQGQIALAQTRFRKENGRFRSLTESADSWDAGASAQAYNRIGERVAFYGSLGWEYFAGKNMGSQVLMDPAYNPVNFLESSDETPGTKKRERYSLVGGMSYRLSPRWAAGVQLNYTSADQTKVKDPRFSNIWMDMDVKAGISFQASQKLLLGLAFQYRNTLEQVKGGVYGTTDQQYFVQTDKGNFLGTVAELAGDYNHISVSNPRPMMNHFVGGSVQLVVDKRFTNELWLQARSGYYGRKSSATATFFEFGGMGAGYKGKLLLASGNNLQILALDASVETLTNRENKFQYITPTGQNTIVEYLGQEVISERLTAQASLSYAWHKDATAGLPTLTLGAKLDGRFKNQNVSLFPLTRKQQLMAFGADIYGVKRFAAGPVQMDVELHALCGGGGGNPAEDDMDAAAASTTIKSFDSPLYRQFEFETAFRAGAEVGLTFRLPVKGRWFPYLRVQERYLSLLHSPQYLDGRGRNSALLSIGCSF